MHTPTPNAAPKQNDAHDNTPDDLAVSKADAGEPRAVSVDLDLGYVSVPVSGDTVEFSLEEAAAVERSAEAWLFHLAQLPTMELYGRARRRGVPATPAIWSAVSIIRRLCGLS